MHFTLSDLVTDITQNASESGAALVELDVRESDREFRFEVRDNGKGMSREELDRAKDPFGTDGQKHPERKVGLGIPFLMQTASQSGGGWNLQSEKSRGTTVSAWFDTTNVDTPPVGDLPGLFRTVFLFPGPEEVVVRRFFDKDGRKNNYEVRKSELTEALGDLEDGSSLALLDRYLRSIETED
ncbi:MAG: ATP-binding protein [Spirochaetaceae bacterium]|jgi:hypothetical protein|nr:ATP-binding protein [Spirochaetaceae bacterium]